MITLQKPSTGHLYFTIDQNGVTKNLLGNKTTTSTDGSINFLDHTYNLACGEDVLGHVVLLEVKTNVFGKRTARRVEVTPIVQ